MGKRQEKSRELAESRIGEVWEGGTIIGLGGKNKRGGQMYTIEGSDKPKSYGNIKAHKSSNNRHLRPFEAAFNLLVRGAQHRKLEVTLTYEDYFEIAGSDSVCFYSGESIPWNKYLNMLSNGKWESVAYFIDRKDPNKGYTKENSVPCSTTHNRAKGQLTAEAYFTKLNK